MPEPVVLFRPALMAPNDRDTDPKTEIPSVDTESTPVSENPAAAGKRQRSTPRALIGVAVGGLRGRSLSSGIAGRGAFRPHPGRDPGLSSGKGRQGSADRRDPQPVFFRSRGRGRLVSPIIIIIIRPHRRRPRAQRARIPPLGPTPHPGGRALTRQR